MRDYNRNDRGGDRGGERFLHHATCAQCGKDCEVPFRPSGDRPVYCSNCFEQRRNEDGNYRESPRRNFGRSNFAERRSYSPDRGGNVRGRDSGQLIDQLKSLHLKLDKILRILEPKAETSLVPKTETTALVQQPKAEKPKVSRKKVKEEKVEIEKTLEN